MNMNKEVMITLRITPSQYLKLLEALVKTNMSKSEFLREALIEYINKMNSKSCRKKDVINCVYNIN